MASSDESFRLTAEATTLPTSSRDFRLPAEELLVWQLSDSAFPTGSFAHSAGLEAAWQAGEIADGAALRRFTHAVLEQTGHGVLPLLNAAHRDPARFEPLDGLADLFLINPVANRASRVQGRALAATMARVWPAESVSALADRVDRGIGHHGPVMGAMFGAAGLPLDVSQRLCLYAAARGVLTAAVRLGIVGSYESQRLQHDLGPALIAIAERACDYGEDDLAQTAPVLDVLQSAHDRLYSRLFQS
jgi:urease accessory protein